VDDSIPLVSSWEGALAFRDGIAADFCDLLAVDADVFLIAVVLANILVFITLPFDIVKATTEDHIKPLCAFGDEGVARRWLGNRRGENGDGEEEKEEADELSELHREGCAVWEKMLEGCLRRFDCLRGLLLLFLNCWTVEL
jgi:hypothetical protein